MTATHYLVWVGPKYIANETFIRYLDRTLRCSYLNSLHVTINLQHSGGERQLFFDRGVGRGVKIMRVDTFRAGPLKSS